MAKSSSKSAGGKQTAGGKRGQAGNAAGATDAELVKSQPETATSATSLRTQAEQSGMPSAGAQQSAIEALKQDHRRVEGLFAEFESGTNEQRKEELVAMICAELNIHTRLEEEIFYPACREALDDSDIMDEAQVEHDAAKLLIADLSEASSDDPFFDAKVKLLSEQIKHHVAEEEKPGEGVFAKAEEHEIDKPELAAELAGRKQELQRRAARLRPTRAVSFNLDVTNLMEDSMARYSDNGRDERGRFRSRDDDDDRRRRGNDRDERGRFLSRDDDDDDRGGRGRGRGYFGDSEGHSRVARQRWEDDDRRGGSRSRYDDDDDDRGGRGRGGWFGDSEGHSRAARERWDEDDDDRRGSRSRGSRYEDDDDDDRGGRGRGRGGWVGDSEGHSRAARERWEDDDDRGGRGRGGSRSRGRDDDDDYDRGGRGRGRGWFGDSEGHSRAARSRRDDDDDDDRGSRSRSRSRRDDDDEDRGGRGSGHGGWFGDPQGHARAARARWR